MFDLDNLENSPSDFKNDIETAMQARIYKRVSGRDFPESYYDNEEKGDEDV